MNFEIINWQQIVYLGQIILSVLLGAILGVQRERWGKWAGPRTYALVAAGSTMFTLLSLNFFTNTSAVASTVVSGIGFLGAGTILHKENRVEGLTTAAGLWMVAAIGMAIGLNQYILAVVTTLIILLVLMLNDKSLKKEE